MENNRQEQSDEPGQEINANFKGNRGKNPNSKEALEKDLINEAEYSEGDGTIVDSSDPSSQEWGAREDTNKDKGEEKRKQ